MSKIYNLLACHRSRAKKNRMITWIVGIKYGSTKIIWTLSNRFRKALFKIFFFQISRWCCKYSSRSRDMWYVNTSYVERKIIFFSNHHSQPRPSSPSKPLPFSRRGGAGGEITGRRVLPLLPVRLSSRTPPPSGRLCPPNPRAPSGRPRGSPPLAAVVSPPRSAGCWAGVERSGDTIELGSILSWTFLLLVRKASTLLRSDWLNYPVLSGVSPLEFAVARGDQAQICLAGMGAPTPRAPLGLGQVYRWWISEFWRLQSFNLNLTGDL